MHGLLTRSQRGSLDSMASHYHQQVGLVAEYLQGRGFGQDAADTYLLGAVGVPLPGHEQYEGRLVIPYLTPAGCVDLRFRAIVDAGGPKYLGRDGSTPHLFNVGALWRDSPIIAVCEGELDAIAMEHLVGIPAVGVPGATQWKDKWARLLADYDRVYVMCDGDEAGRTFGRTLAKTVDETVVIHLPEGEDVNSLAARGGRDAVQAVMGL
jgi:DNA primase